MSENRMSATTKKPEPMIHRQAVHRQLRDLMIAQSWLASDIDPVHKRTNVTGDYTDRILSRADGIVRTLLDPIFGDHISLSQTAYKTQVKKFLNSSEQQTETVETLKTQMLVGPYKPYHSTYANAAVKVLNESLRANIGLPLETPEPETLLSNDLLAARINGFFQEQQELAFSRSARFPMSAAGTAAAIKTRAEALTNIAMEALSQDVKTIPAFKSRLTNMAKPDSKLVGALTEFLNTKSGEYPAEMYESRAGNRVADAISQRYVSDLCDHLKNWVQVEHVTVAKTDPKAPGTQALTEQLGATKGKGQSAA